MSMTFQTTENKQKKIVKQLNNINKSIFLMKLTRDLHIIRFISVNIRQSNIPITINKTVTD